MQDTKGADAEGLDHGELLTLGVVDPAELASRALRNAAKAASPMKSTDVILRAET
jgi:chaperonin GroEL (HSP60 family)